MLPSDIKILIVRDFGNFYPEFVYAFPSTIDYLVRNRKKYAELIVIHNLVRRALQYDIRTAQLFASHFNVTPRDIAFCKNYTVINKILKKTENLKCILKELCIAGRFDILCRINTQHGNKECLIECIKHRNIDCAMLFIEYYDDKLNIKPTSIRGKAKGTVNDFKKFYKMTKFSIGLLISPDRSDLCEWYWGIHRILFIPTFPSKNFTEKCDRQQLWFRYYCSIFDTVNAIEIYKMGDIGSHANISGIFKNATTQQIEWIFSVIQPTRITKVLKEIVKLDRCILVENILSNKMLPRIAFIHGSDNLIDYIIKYSPLSHKALVDAAIKANSRHAMKKLGKEWYQEKITKIILRKYRKGLGLFITDIDYVLGFYNYRLLF